VPPTKTDVDRWRQSSTSQVGGTDAAHENYSTVYKEYFSPIEKAFKRQCVMHIES